MSTKNPPTEERIASRRLLGVDVKGREYRWDSVYEMVYVFDGDEHLLTHTVADHPLSEYVERVETEIGWTDLHFSAHPFGALKKIEVSD